MKPPVDTPNRTSWRRLFSWALLLVALGLFLVWPAGKVFDLPWASLPAPAWASDRAWNPGALMLAHQPLEGKCEACHQVAFQQTADSACLECHQKIGHHVAQSLRPASLFDGVRCAECHRDHKGLKARHRDDDRFCVDCHQDIQKRAPGVESKNVADFAREHPPFRLTLPADKGGPVNRVRQEKSPVTHRSGLLFPHDVHLDRGGVKHPDKGTIQIDCEACHRPDTSKRSFEPISMGRHCQECHKLEFEPAVTNRQVPHAAPAEAMTVVREFYANLALNGVQDSFQKAFGVPGEGLLRRVGDPSPAQRQNALAIAQRKADQVAEELFEIRSCKTCHELIREDMPQGRRWTVTRVLNGHTWMPQARFDHKAHAQSKCGDCHDVAKSKRAEDLAMPTIETCRECHAGSKPVLDRLTSNCLLCHGFHEHANPWDPSFKPKSPTPRMAGAARAP
jgi:predicted CXXCH cytochrome family protein